MSTVLDISGLSVRLPANADRLHAIEDMSLHVDAGETLCVVGESGSGKSVCAQAIMGLLPRPHLEPVAGNVTLLGESLLDATPKRLRALRGERMSMIFQEPMTALNPVMRCGRQIEEVLATHTEMTPAERAARVREVMVAVNLPEPDKLIHAYPHQLSGGQRQRIMIAMALVLEPALLIADEPTTALDVTTQAQILALIKRIQVERQTGVLFITHDFGVVAEIADRVAVMQNGNLVETGETRRVLIAPEHDYTRMLMAAVPSLEPPQRSLITASHVALQTRSLAKVYGGGGLRRRQREVHAARDVDIKIHRGETLGIVGESGSGKSTVARCIMRLVEPTAGEVLLHGEQIGHLSARALRPHRRRIQIIFQDPYRSLDPRQTVGSAIMEGPRNYGLSRESADARTVDLLTLVGIEPAARSRFPHQFSGGQRQRICIARALAMEPEVLVADEAVSALDVSIQAQVLKLLDEVRKRFDLALLFITHDLRVAAQICDRIAVMHLGKVVETGPTAEVFANPRDDYTKLLFEAAPGRGWQFGRIQSEAQTAQ